MADLIIDNEFRDLIPPLSDDEKKQLKENILRDGIQDPLKVWQGTLIDGHNRYEIAQAHGLTFETAEMEFASRDDVIIWIIKNQFGRRNLSAYDRSILALKLKPVIAAKAKENSLANLKQNTDRQIFAHRDEESKQTETADERKTNAQIAEQAGVSRETIRKVEKIEAQATPEVKAALKSGEMSINQAFKEIKNAEKVQRQEETRERKAYTPPTELPADKVKLICADIRDGLAEIADNSVDFIITDPPYPKEFLPLYENLSKVAARVLKDGGSLICMTGQSYLPDVIRLLLTSLNYHWCLSYVTMGDKTQIWKSRVHTAWKPLLWFVKGEYKGDWLGDDVVTSTNKDKTFHEWGQSFGGMKTLIERMTYPDDIILDPFLGGGTTGLAALKSGRKFIGVDIEQSCVDITKTRIVEAFANG
ncbi:MAG: hypothetical protein IJ774_05780 [Selenomonadaceae bacterium]|nr:hypothetical protein [Selenomonadaceae bacterium]MBR1805885.1 hypothetical protein [Selenomonadaceae bacterium]